MSEKKEYTCETGDENVHEISLQWKIDNPSNYLFSEVFDIDVGKCQKLRIQLFLERGWECPEEGEVNSKVLAKYKAKSSLKIINMDLLSDIQRTVEMHRDPKYKDAFSHICDDENGDWIKEACPISFKIDVRVMELKSDIESYTPTVPNLDTNSLIVGILNDLEKMHINQTLTDFKLCSVEGTVFPVHKAMLSCRSPYLKRIFEKDESKILQIPIKAEVLEEVLIFIYTGKIPNVKKMCMDLLEAAFKLELRGLLSVCEAVVISQLSVDDAPKTLVLADDYSMLALRKEAISFIVENAEQVGELAAWREMMKTHPHLIAEVTFQLQVANSKKISNVPECKHLK